MKNLIETFFNKFGIKFTSHKNGREFLFRCPFHNDNKPSMWMNTITGKYHCFACLAGGHSLEQFIKRLTGETIKIEDYLTEADYFTSLVKQIYENSARNILGIQNTFDFLKICEQEFTNFGPVHSNSMAYQYLKSKRKFTDKTINDFKLKFAVDGDYKDRVIIPYFKGDHLVGFNSRLTGATKEFLKDCRYRYLVNMSEFNDYVYGLDRVVGNEFVIVVEGPFDLMYLYQCGFKNVISPLTTRLTSSQFFKFHEAKKIIFCYDNDENKKGFEGMMKAANLIFKLDDSKQIYSMNLPDFKDPNECSLDELVYASKHLKKISFKNRNSSEFNVNYEAV